MQTKKGLTLVELLVTIAIIAILFLVTTPSLINYFSDAKIRTAADEIQVGIQQAKVEAIKRNTIVSFNLTGTGWTINIPQNGNNLAILLASRPAPANENMLSVSPSTLTILFNGFGQVTPVGTDYTIGISNPSQGSCVNSSGKVRCLNIQITSMGEAKVCDPALASTDPRAC